MKYRRLSIEELEELREEFVLFLASNSIAAADWQEIKIKQPDRMNELLDLFSDMVIDKALRNISSLKIVAQFELYLFLFEQTDAKVIRFSISEAGGLDLRDDQTLVKLATGEIELSNLSPELYKGNKILKGKREEEMYELLSKGAVPCARTLFDAFAQLAG